MLKKYSLPYWRNVSLGHKCLMLAHPDRYTRVDNLNHLRDHLKWLRPGRFDIRIGKKHRRKDLSHLFLESVKVIPAERRSFYELYWILKVWRRFNEVISKREGAFRRRFEREERRLTSFLLRELPLKQFLAEDFLTYSSLSDALRFLRVLHRLVDLERQTVLAEAILRFTKERLQPLDRQNADSEYRENFAFGLMMGLRATFFLPAQVEILAQAVEFIGPLTKRDTGEVVIYNDMLFDLLSFVDLKSSPDVLRYVCQVIIKMSKVHLDKKQIADQSREAERILAGIK